MATSDPVRDRMAALTRSISALKKPIRRAMEGGEGFSNGTTTAKGSLRQGRTRDNRNAMVGGQAPEGACAPGSLARHKGHVAPRARWVNVPDVRVGLRITSGMTRRRPVAVEGDPMREI